APCAASTSSAAASGVVNVTTVTAPRSRAIVTSSRSAGVRGASVCSRSTAAVVVISVQPSLGDEVRERAPAGLARAVVGHDLRGLALGPWLGGPHDRPRRGCADPLGGDGEIGERPRRHGL